MDRFDDLSTFVLVSELRSVRKAAEILGRAPSAVSRRIKELEDRLQVQLLTRTTRKMTLTGAGERFLADAKRVLDQLEEAEATASADSQHVSGELRITMPLSFGLAHVASALEEFMLQNPDVRVDADFNDRAVSLSDNRIDLAIRIGTLADSSLKARRLAPIHHVVAASPEFWEQHGTPRSPDKLSGMPGLCYSNLSSPHLWPWSNAKGVRGKVSVTPRYQATNGDALISAAVRGMGVVRLPTFLLNEPIQQRLLQPVLLTTNWGTSSLYALYPNTNLLPYRTRTFIDYLAERFSGQPSWDECLRAQLKKIGKAPPHAIELN